MNVHVFVATTKGLVNINSLRELPSALMSTVTIAGSADECPIKNSYHNFVKPGTGIIADEFGHGSFRVDVSHSIDQGNSWQLGFYIAHLAHSRGILASENQQAQDKDLVICATGCVKTSNRQITQVGDVPKKLRLANQDLVEISADCRVVFALPKDNLEGIESDHHFELQALETLDDAEQLMPTSASEITVKNATNSKPSFRGVAWSLALFLVLGAVGSAYYFDIDFGIDQQKTPQQAIHVSAPTASKPKPQLDTPDPDTEPSSNRTNTWVLADEVLADNCLNNTYVNARYKNLVLKQNAFTSTIISSELCGVRIVLNQEVKTSFLIKKTKERLIFVNKTNQDEIFVDVPKIDYGKATYFLVAFGDVQSRSNIDKVRGFLFEYTKPNTLQFEELHKVLSNVSNNFRLYEHAFEYDKKKKL